MIIQRHYTVNICKTDLSNERQKHSDGTILTSAKQLDYLLSVQRQLIMAGPFAVGLRRGVCDSRNLHAIFQLSTDSSYRTTYLMS